MVYLQAKTKQYVKKLMAPFLWSPPPHSILIEFCLNQCCKLRVCPKFRILGSKISLFCAAALLPVCFPIWDASRTPEQNCPEISFSLRYFMNGSCFALMLWKWNGSGCLYGLSVSQPWALYRGECQSVVICSDNNVTIVSANMSVC